MSIQTVSQAFTNEGVGGFSFRNRIINGDMRIDQRNAGASVTPADGAYTLDRWNYNATQASKMSVQQSTTAPVGFSNSMLITTTTAVSVGAGDTFSTIQAIEGFNFADCAWGTANAKTITLSFWVRSSLTGTFGGALLNSAQNRSYPFTYTISSADTFEYKTVTIAGDTTGTWIGATNGVGVRVCFDLGAGSTYAGTAGAWTGSAKYAATGSVSVVGTLNATWYITGVQLEVGSVTTPFERRPYGVELALCQRYYERWQWDGDNTGIAMGGYADTNTWRGIYSYKVTKRANPSFSTSGSFIIQGGATNYSSSGLFTIDAKTNSTLMQATATGIGTGYAAWLLANTNFYMAFSSEL
jgi:hypothetical protein